MVLDRALTAVAVGVLCLPVVAGCGADGREAGAAGAASRFLSSLDKPDSACALLSPKARTALESGGEPCARALADLRLPGGQVTDATVWSERARVRTNGDTLFLVELDTGWRVTAAGCGHRTEDTYECALES